MASADRSATRAVPKAPCYKRGVVRIRQVRLTILSFVCAAAALAAVFVLAPTGSGGTNGAAAVGATIAPALVADAYVRADRPSANFGKARSYLVARRPAAVAYLRFRVSVPRGLTVSGATLRLFAASNASGAFTVHRVASSAWGETTTTYRNAPRLGPVVGTSGGRHPGDASVSIDVSRLVTGSGLVSLALKAASPAALAFSSRESATGRPRLVVAVSAPTPNAPANPAAPAPAPGTTTPATPAAPGGGGGGGGGSAAVCGTAGAPPQRVDHVIWIWMENKPYDSIIGSPSAPFESSLASACGLATSYHAVTHPSLPNYIAATSGSTQGVADDDPPSVHQLDAANIFSQVKAAGKTWRAYAESAPGSCPLVDAGRYAVKHVPAAYYTNLRGDCASSIVPMGTSSSGSLLDDLNGSSFPTFAFVTPDLCNDTHDCPVSVGDAWLQAWFAKIVASPTYQAGRTVVLLTWDEDDDSAANRVPLVVVSPSTPAGTKVGAAYDHYSLLRTTEQLLGLAYLGRAADASSMAPAFNLG